MLGTVLNAKIDLNFPLLLTKNPLMEALFYRREVETQWLMATHGNFKFRQSGSRIWF